VVLVGMVMNPISEASWVMVTVSGDEPVSDEMLKTAFRVRSTAWKLALLIACMLIASALVCASVLK
jgi:hypothetical protein